MRSNKCIQSNLSFLILRQFFCVALRTIFTFVHSIAPFSIIYTILSITTFPAPPLIILNIIPIEFLIKYQIQFFHLFIYSSLESIWFIINSIIRSRISSSVSTREKLGTEERWRLWVRILESDPDPFSFLKGAFTKRGITKLPRGMSDVDAIDIGADEIGATNVMMVSLSLTCTSRKLQANPIFCLLR